MGISRAMDERRRATPRTGIDTASAITRHSPAVADTNASAPHADALDEAQASTSGPTLLDPRDPSTQARLQERQHGGSYSVSDADLVLAMRGWDAHGDRARVRALGELLVDRCMPEFQRRSWGLRHRPDLMEDAIGGMVEQLLREALDPREIFMTQNFIHYLRCLCADNFSRTLRQEGLSYRRDEQGRPAGRPQHIPRALIERIDLSAEEQEDAGAQAQTVADPRDVYEDRMAAVEAQRILSYLPDPLDRRIMALRVFERLQWEEIAALCGKTERTMRLRYEKARTLLQQRLSDELAQAAGA
jgi:DNA-directed RNA polymerase specialized sigma24 family protein